MSMRIPNTSSRLACPSIDAFAVPDLNHTDDESFIFDRIDDVAAS